MRPEPSWTAQGPCTPLDEGLHETVARTARARPGAPALIADRQVTTYAELDATADAWAADLAARGVRPGDFVPVLLPRSTELVTALLAVLKTGAAYALLDPAWPARRLHEVIQDLAPPLLVTGAPAAPFPASGAQGSTGPRPPVWTPPAKTATAPPHFRPVGVSGTDPACVFFTSGTTGRPKGVVSPHRATARLFPPDGPDGFVPFGAGTVMPLAAPVPWDAFSLELWAVLLHGGTSLIVQEPYLTPQFLREGVRRYGANTAWLTSSLFNMTVDEDVAAFDGLRHVVIGGERVSPAHAGRFLRRHPRTALINGYGPVESTVFATTHRITPADCAHPDGIPLGRPVARTQVYVLDGDRPCAVDEPGEICVAGDGLALRYLGDAALTDAKFVTVRVDGKDRRVYRTGDLGHWGADGLLRFRGRADRQVKIRGHRIEPAEVERQVVRLLPAVRDCRVLARRDAEGTAQELVAFCVPVRRQDPLRDALPALCDALVPYQRPAALVSVDAFPVTAQGKLDERALLALAPPAAPGPRPAGTPPVQGAREELGGLDRTTRAVAETFAAVLGRTAVPLDAPFDRLGGGSLAAGRVCARLAARLGRPVPVSRLYAHPTVTALAGWLRTTGRPAARRPAPLADVPLTSMQLVYLTRHLLDPADPASHCLLTWVIEGRPDRAALQAAISAVHRRHEPLRAAYVPDPRPVAFTVDIEPPPLEVLGARPTVEAALQALRAELAGPLEPTAGEVWRTALVPVGTSDVTVLGCVVHHIAFDGWSESVLAEDLAAAYNSASGGPRTTPPPPPTLAQAHLIRTEHLEQAGLDGHREHLRGELTGVPALRWPAGPDRPARQPAGATDRVEVILTPAAVAAADALAAEAGVTRFTVLLTHWARSLAEATGQRDFALGVPVAQRFGTGLERAVGCHITMVCVRLRGPALEGGVRGVRETGRLVARAFAAQDVPFGEVLDLADAPRTHRPPLFQALFALQDNAPPRLALTGLRTTFLRRPYLGLPLELHAELWPEEGGGLRLEVAFRTQAVSRTTAEECAKRFADHLHTTLSGVPS
ncbi:amino acid adenylation domain-containing protein [Streptomyces sp. MST-110588]|uniref:amino acid adenylation domain-containing protein n=1 Tax=Streptomyces sp. MST-110588 TaxID=2833628 RepID=UPI001F5C16C1|nr:amino acid adenylation domain-containing protein [Streptomyces sp. MST-110588]UNO39193.1 amino acid adenylation domain-containing protein [Streptomyces sp. MST-110588]